jgi:hypothetical protein
MEILFQTKYTLQYSRLRKSIELTKIDSCTDSAIVGVEPCRSIRHMRLCADSATSGQLERIDSAADVRKSSLPELRRIRRTAEPGVACTSSKEGV